MPAHCPCVDAYRSKCKKKPKKKKKCPSKCSKDRNRGGCIGLCKNKPKKQNDCCPCDLLDKYGSERQNFKDKDNDSQKSENSENKKAKFPKDSRSKPKKGKSKPSRGKNKVDLGGKSKKDLAKRTKSKVSTRKPAAVGRAPPDFYPMGGTYIPRQNYEYLPNRVNRGGYGLGQIPFQNGYSSIAYPLPQHRFNEIVSDPQTMRRFYQFGNGPALPPSPVQNNIAPPQLAPLPYTAATSQIIVPPSQMNTTPFQYNTPAGQFTGTLSNYDGQTNQITTLSPQYISTSSNYQPGVSYLMKPTPPQSASQCQSNPLGPFPCPEVCSSRNTCKKPFCKYPPSRRPCPKFDEDYQCDFSPKCPATNQSSRQMSQMNSSTPFMHGMNVYPSEQTLLYSKKSNNYPTAPYPQLENRSKNRFNKVPSQMPQQFRPTPERGGNYQIDQVPPQFHPIPIPRRGENYALGQAHHPIHPFPMQDRIDNRQMGQVPYGSFIHKRGDNYQYGQSMHQSKRQPLNSQMRQGTHSMNPSIARNTRCKGRQCDAASSPDQSCQDDESTCEDDQSSNTTVASQASCEKTPKSNCIGCCDKNNSTEACTECDDQNSLNDTSLKGRPRLQDDFESLSTSDTDPEEKERMCQFGKKKRIPLPPSCCSPLKCTEPPSCRECSGESSDIPVDMPIMDVLPKTKKSLNKDIWTRTSIWASQYNASSGSDNCL